MPEKGSLTGPCQADFLVISEYTNEIIGGDGGVEKKCILKDIIKCVLQIRSKMKLERFVNSVFFCFTKILC